MISWIQNTFQRHFRILFLVLLAVIIVAFVFTIGAAPGIGQADRQAQAREFFGANLNSPEASQRVFGDANLSVMLRVGYPALQAEQLQEYALQRHAGLHLANELRLPAPTADELSTFIRSLRGFAGPDGQFDAQAYARFRDSLRTNPQLTEADVSRVLADDYRYDQLQQLLGGPGYVLPSELRQQLVLAESQWTLNVAAVDFASFNPDIQPTDAQLQAYFENNTFRYEIPPHVKVSFVDFPAAAYLGQVNVTEQEVRAYYDANPARFPAPSANGQTPAVSAGDDEADANFAAVRDRVESTLRLERARRRAAQDASDLTVALFDARVAPEAISGFLTERGHQLRSVPPFPRNAVPVALGANRQVGDEAFRLGEDRRVSDALPTPNGAVVLVWEETMPARTPEFAAARDAVLADYLENEKRQRFVAAGRQMRDTLTNRLQAGESFAAAAPAAAAQAGAQVEIKNHGPFTLRQPPEELPRPALGTLERLQQGQVSDLVFSGEKGYLVHAAAKQEPDVAADSPAAAEMRTQMARFNAARNANDYLRTLVEQELARTAPPAS